MIYFVLTYWLFVRRKKVYFPLEMKCKRKLHYSISTSNLYLSKCTQLHTEHLTADVLSSWVRWVCFTTRWRRGVTHLLQQPPQPNSDIWRPEDNMFYIDRHKHTHTHRFYTTRSKVHGHKPHDSSHFRAFSVRTCFPSRLQLHLWSFIFLLV